MNEMKITNPGGVDAFDECPRSLRRLDRHLEDPIDVDVVGLQLMGILRCGPADENALVELSLEGEMLGRRN